MAFYFITLHQVPFHPDESTQIFMSDDVDLFFSKPSSLLYAKNDQTDPKQTYRFLDSPLTRYAIGIARNLTDQPALASDWDWTKSWSENQAAMPDPALLVIARFSVAFVFPLSVLLLFFITRKLFSTDTALLASFMLMSNAVILLHTRRAMAESLMVFFMLLSIWVIFSLKPNRFFLSAIPIALAINTKQSLLFLIPAAILITLFNQTISWAKVKQLALFIFLILLITFILNPILWNNPIEAASLMLEKRADLLASQVAAIQSVSPDFVLTSPLERLLGYLAQTFITAPAYQDVANYQRDLQPAIQHYQQTILHIGILRSLLPGIILFVVSLMGFIFILLEKQRQTLSFLLLFGLALIEVLIVFPIPFQRYYLPLYPFVSVFISFFITRLFWGFKQLLNPAARTKEQTSG